MLRFVDGQARIENRRVMIHATPAAGATIEYPAKSIKMKDSFWTIL